MNAGREVIRATFGWGPGRRPWSRRRTHVVLRCALLVAGYLAWGALTFLLVRDQPSSGTSVYRTNPGPVELILAGLLGALLVGTGTLAWRVVRHSGRTGVAGVTVAALTGVMALVGMLTVGLFIVPIAVVLALLALPLPPEDRTPPPPTGATPPGWYEAPGDPRAWRFWDGWRWTGWVITTRNRDHER